MPDLSPSERLQAAAEKLRRRAVSSFADPGNPAEMDAEVAMALADLLDGIVEVGFYEGDPDCKAALRVADEVLR